jgi:parvulin-like peptidyl-prolyl isomerase
MASSTGCSLSAQQEAEAQALRERLREIVDEELLQVARLLVSKAERAIFGETEFQLRDILLKAGAKALQEHLRQKKTATTGAVSTARSVSKRPSSRAIGPSPR